MFFSFDKVLSNFALEHLKCFLVQILRLQNCSTFNSSSKENLEVFFVSLPNIADLNLIRCRWLVWLNRNELLMLDKLIWIVTLYHRLFGEYLRCVTFHRVWLDVHKVFLYFILNCLLFRPLYSSMRKFTVYFALFQLLKVRLTFRRNRLFWITD